MRYHRNVVHDESGEFMYLPTTAVVPAGNFWLSRRLNPGCAVDRDGPRKCRFCECKWVLCART